MGARQFTKQTGMSPLEAGAPGENSERSLTLLIEGAALNMPELDAESYQLFRANVARLSQQMPDRLPQEEKLASIREVLREFETYRGGAESAVRERQAGWRALAASLLHELLANLGIPASSTSASPLLRQIGQLTTAPEIEACRASLEDFLRPGGAAASHAAASQLRKADRSTANDNAAGLRGGGAAIEHLAGVMAAGRGGFVTLFRMSCLDVINQRFGMDAVEDCHMAVSAFLTHSLRSDDRIFHWSDSSLLAILLDRPNEHIVTAELQRIASQNRDITIKVSGRIVMLRIPLAFELIPIEKLKSADEIARLSGTQTVQGNGR